MCTFATKLEKVVFVFMSTQKKLRRSNESMLAGVCAGLAEYFDVDPTMVRIVYALLTIFTAFSGIIVYLVLMFVMPRK